MAMDETSLTHFEAWGWMRVPGAFSANEARAMRAAIWRALAVRGIDPDNPASWGMEPPAYLQDVKTDPVFHAVASAKTRAAIGAVLGMRDWPEPKNWGAPFIAFPNDRPWRIPASGWHADANYLSALSPPDGLRLHALFGDVVPRGGGTLFLGGSHKLIHKWFKENPPPPKTRGAEFRALLQGHPYIHALHTDGDDRARVERFMAREDVDGIALQVFENTGAAGDVLIAHPLLLHVAAANTGASPRFLLSGGIDRPAMWAALTQTSSASPSRRPR
jgi:hypothetical protein